MKVIDAKVEWHLKFSNYPSLKILVDHLPSSEDHKFTESNNIYYSELDGHVIFYYYEKPGDGFGGREISLTMEDGTVKVLKGPWSVGAQNANEEGFEPCATVSITDDPQVWERGHTFYSSNVTHKILRESAKVAGCYLIKYDGNLVPSLDPKQLVAWKSKDNGKTKYKKQYSPEKRNYQFPKRK